MLATYIQGKTVLRLPAYVHTTWHVSQPPCTVSYCQDTFSVSVVLNKQDRQCPQDISMDCSFLMHTHLTTSDCATSPYRTPSIQDMHLSILVGQCLLHIAHCNHSHNYIQYWSSRVSRELWWHTYVLCVIRTRNPETTAHTYTLTAPNVTTAAMDTLILLQTCARTHFRTSVSGSVYCIIMCVSR